MRFLKMFYSLLRNSHRTPPIFKPNVEEIWGNRPKVVDQDDAWFLKKHTKEHLYISVFSRFILHIVNNQLNSWHCVGDRLIIII